MYVCVYSYRCMHVGIRVCICMHVWVLSMYLYLFVCVWLRVAVFQTRLVRFEPSYKRPGPDPDSYPLWTRYICDSKTDLWDDPWISASSCSEDQTAIRFRNCVISCECSLLCIYRCRYALHVALIISCDFLLYFTSLITCIRS